MTTIRKNLSVMIFATLLLTTGTQLCVPAGETKKNDTSEVQWAVASVGAGAATLFWKSCDSAKILYDQASVLNSQWFDLVKEWFGVMQYCQDNKFSAVLNSTMSESIKQRRMIKSITAKMSNFIEANAGMALQEKFKNINFADDNADKAFVDFAVKAHSRFNFVKTIDSNSLMAKLYTPILIAGSLVTVFAVGKTMHSLWKNYQQKKQAKNNITSWSKEVCSISLCNN